MATAAVALSLLLGGCGGGSDNDVDMGTMPTPMDVSMAMVTEDGAGYTAPTAGGFMIAAGGMENRGSVEFTCAAGGEDCMVMVAADGMVTSTGGMVSAMNSKAYQAALDANQAAQDSAMQTEDALDTITALNDGTTELKMLAGPAEMEGSARMMAMEYSMMISTLATDGNSMVAVMNAQGVLDAREELESVRMEVERERTAAMAARMGFADDEPLAMLLDDAIMRADEQIGMAEMVLEETGGGSLKFYEEMVTGMDMEMPMTADDKGEEVAMAIAESASADEQLQRRRHPGDPWRRRARRSTPSRR